MKTETAKYLHATKRQLDSALDKISSRQTTTRPLTETERAQMLGLGSARDWVRWAVALEGIRFGSKSERQSARKAGIIESMRFTQIWTGTNALFSRDSILSVFGPLPASDREVDRFTVLYSNAGITPAIETTALSTLYRLLDMECDTDDVAPMLTVPTTPARNPNLAAPAYPTMWEVVFHKYSRVKDQTRGIGKVIGDALAAHNFPRPDAPTLIYGARNWTVHGMLLTSFFRGSQRKYETFIDNINLLLAAALAGVSQQLATKI